MKTNFGSSILVALVIVNLSVNLSFGSELSPRPPKECRNATSVSSRIDITQTPIEPRIVEKAFRSEKDPVREFAKATKTMADISLGVVSGMYFLVGVATMGMIPGLFAYGNDNAGYCMIDLFGKQCNDVYKKASAKSDDHWVSRALERTMARCNHYLIKNYPDEILAQSKNETMVIASAHRCEPKFDEVDLRWTVEVAEVKTDQTQAQIDVYLNQAKCELINRCSRFAEATEEMEWVRLQREMFSCDYSFERKLP